MSLLQSLRFPLRTLGCWSVTTSLRALHLWQINTFCCHICNGCVGIGAPLAQLGSSRRRRRGTVMSKRSRCGESNAEPGREPTPRRNDGATSPGGCCRYFIAFAIWSSFWSLYKFEISFVWRLMDYPQIVGYILSWVGCVSLTLSFVTTTFMAKRSEWCYRKERLVAMIGSFSPKWEFWFNQLHWTRKN